MLDCILEMYHETSHEYRKYNQTDMSRLQFPDCRPDLYQSQHAGSPSEDVFEECASGSDSEVGHSELCRVNNSLCHKTT